MVANTQNYSVNLGDYQIVGMRVVEKLPPNSPFAKLMGEAGTQTTPSLGRGNLNGSAIALLNGNLEHACDFKFLINVDVFASFGLVNPVEAIQKALKDAKSKATERLKGYLKESVALIRKGIEAIMKVLGYDPSGELSLSFQIGKDLLADINKAIEDVAEKVAEVMEWVFFAQQVQQLINYIKSLPAKLQKLLATCVSNFTNSLKQIATSLQSIPDQIVNATESQIQGIVNQFTQAAQEVATAAQGALNDHTSTMPDALYQALLDPSVETATALDTHIQNTSNTANESANTTTSNIQTGISTPGW